MPTMIAIRFSRQGVYSVRSAAREGRQDTTKQGKQESKAPPRVHRSVVGSDPQKLLRLRPGFAVEFCGISRTAAGLLTRVSAGHLERGGAASSPGPSF